MKKAQKPLFAEPGVKEAQLRAWMPEAWAMDEGWQAVVVPFWTSAQGAKLADFIRGRLADGAVVYPPQPLRALELTPLASVKVVILGQDPYHGPGQAEGLAFSVAEGVRVPPSLRNIFKELQREGLLDSSPASIIQQGSLQRWARAGVLLLNTCLTVEDGLPASHAKQGWEALTDALLAQVAATVPACVYLLWGAHAQTKAEGVTQVAAQHGCQALVLKANHPSPLSALRPPTPFIGCGHFQQAQTWLAAQGVALDWAL
jgi:uracil-DNA glycosylase